MYEVWKSIHNSIAGATIVKRAQAARNRTELKSSRVTCYVIYNHNLSTVHIAHWQTSQSGWLGEVLASNES